MLFKVGPSASSQYSGGGGDRAGPLRGCACHNKLCIAILAGGPLRNAKWGEADRLGCAPRSLRRETRYLLGPLSRLRTLAAGCCRRLGLGAPWEFCGSTWHRPRRSSLHRAPSACWPERSATTGSDHPTRNTWREPSITSCLWLQTCLEGLAAGLNFPCL